MRRDSRFAPLRGLVALMGAVACAPVQGATGPWFDRPEVKLRLVTPWQVAAPAATLEAGLEVELTPGWHAYWSNSGDAGFAPRLAPAPGGAVERVRVDYPAPTRFDLPGGLVAFGYAERVTYPLALELARVDAASTAQVALAVDFLVCAEECIPYTATLAVEQAIGAPALADPGSAARLATWRARVPRPLASLAGVAGTAGAPEVAARWLPGDDPWSTLELAFAGGGLELRAPQLFFASHPLLALDRPSFSAEQHRFLFRVPVRPLDETKPLPSTLEVAWTLTGIALGGETLSLAGTSRVAPLAAARSRGLVGWGAAAFVLLIFAVLAHRRHRRRAESTIAP
ncbi:MAG: protein-disulfide reductase DsbD family protein [Thermoanaerobaculia bacterium]